MPVATDEIYEKYLQKAITEINELGHEVAGAAGAERVPVVGSGHPLADVFLLKYRPTARVQEGVALRPQPARRSSSPCSGCASIRWPSTARTASSSPSRTRTRRGRGSRASSTSSSRSCSWSWGPTRARSSTRSRSARGRVDRGRGRAAAIHADHPGGTPDVDTSLDEQPAKTRFWKAFKIVVLVGRAPTVLGRPRLVAGAAVLVALLVYYRVVDSLPTIPTWADVVFTASLLTPAVFRSCCWPCRSRTRAASRSATALLAYVLVVADLDVLANFAKLAAVTLLAFWFLGSSRSLVVIVACVIPLVDAISVWRGPTRHIVEERPEVFGAPRPAFPRQGGAFQLGLLTCSSSRSSSAPRPAGACASSPRGCASSPPSA